ncbi:hypothetical protein BC827DRAFT_52668 [Russula dissimulans]|nr:hypothetical protein BC827DRAFT_52668 [Russula dissimulans]
MLVFVCQLLQERVRALLPVLQLRTPATGGSRTNSIPSTPGLEMAHHAAPIRPHKSHPATKPYRRGRKRYIGHIQSNTRAYTVGGVENGMDGEGGLRNGSLCCRCKLRPPRAFMTHQCHNSAIAAQSGYSRLDAPECESIPRCVEHPGSCHAQRTTFATARSYKNDEARYNGTECSRHPYRGRVNV